MSIKINSLKVDKNSEKSISKGFLYKDIQFDLYPIVSFNNQLAKSEYLKDVAPLYDIEAVKNSLRTALLTAPGQNILNPEYGVDLRQYIFEPVDDFTSEIIQEIIEVKLPKCDSRINIENVSVVGDEDNNTYYISFQIDVPSLDVYGLSIKSELNSTGYTIL